MNIRKHIPNAITCLSLISGCVATVMALDGRLRTAAACVAMAAVFDFLDGLSARLLHAYSAIGKELDSLSDLVCFGLAPGMIVFSLLREASEALPFGGANAYIPFLSCVIPVFSGLRLAKFNVDDRQGVSFLGLPVPAHALFWSSSGYALQPLASPHALLFTLLLIPSILLSSCLLVSEVPMFSLKIQSLGWKGNEKRYALAVGSLGFILLFGFPGIAAAVLLYVLLSVLTFKKENSHV